MLSEEEQRRLDAIERQLESENPKLAKRFASPRARSIRWLTAAAVLNLLAIIATAAAGWWAVSILILVPTLMLTMGTLFLNRSDE